MTEAEHLLNFQIPLLFMSVCRGESNLRLAEKFHILLKLKSDPTLFYQVCVEDNNLEMAQFLYGIWSDNDPTINVIAENAMRDTRDLAMWTWLGSKLQIQTPSAPLATPLAAE
jgi:hypothetical protein